MKHKHLTGLAVLFCIIFALFWAWQQRVEKEAEQAPVLGGMDDGFTAVRREVGKNFEKASAELNEQIATKKEKGDLELTGTEVDDGPSMTYVYTVKKPLENTISEEKIFPLVADKVCSIPEMRDYMPYGVYYTYVYCNEENKELLRIRVDESVCIKKEQADSQKNIANDSPETKPEADKK